MTSLSPTALHFEPIEGYNALYLNWHNRAKNNDVVTILNELNDILEKTTSPLHLIIDLRGKPNIPIHTTVAKVLQGPAFHPMMGYWLLVAPSTTIRIVVNAINAIDSKVTHSWHDTLEEAYEYLHEKATLMVE